jgi:hypothetical protein
VLDGNEIVLDAVRGRARFVVRGLIEVVVNGEDSLGFADQGSLGERGGVDHQHICLFEGRGYFERREGQGVLVEHIKTRILTIWPSKCRKDQIFISLHGDDLVKSDLAHHEFEL